MISTDDKSFQIDNSPEFGRRLVAKKNIQPGAYRQKNLLHVWPGEVLIDEPSVVEGPSSLNWETDFPVCPACYRRVKEGLQCPCPNCNLPLCSDDCAAALVHSSNECKLFSKHPSCLVDMLMGLRPKEHQNVITTFRAVFLRSRDPLKWKQIMVLESKAEILFWKSDTRFTRTLSCILNSLTWKDFDYSSESDICLQGAAMHCLGVLRTNAFSEFTESKGREGLFFFSSFMSHSCITNTCRQFDPTASRIVVRAATLIPKGQPITNTYLSYLSNTRERGEELEAGWGFRCGSDCPRCESLTEMDTFLGSIRCPDCEKLTLCPLPDGRWLCASEHCRETSEEADSRIENTLTQIQGIRKSIPKMNMKMENIKAVVGWLNTPETSKGVFQRSDTRLNSTMEQIEEIKNSIPNMCVDSIEKIESWLQESEQKSLLHPNHSIFTQAKLYLCQSYGKTEGIAALSTQQLLSKASHCRDVLNIVNKIFPESEIHLFRGTILFEYWTSLRELLHRKSTQSESIIVPINKVDLCQDLNDKTVLKTALEASSILKYSLPLTDEDAMNIILNEEVIMDIDMLDEDLT